jgi:cytochrome P450
MTTLWSIQALGRNPIVQNKILDEIESIFGKSQHALSYKDLEKLPYLNATFKEVLRIYPIAALVIRNPAEDVVIGGYNITSDVNMQFFNIYKYIILYNNFYTFTAHYCPFYL